MKFPVPTEMLEMSALHCIPSYQLHMYFSFFLSSIFVRLGVQNPTWHFKYVHDNDGNVTNKMFLYRVISPITGLSLLNVY